MNAGSILAPDKYLLTKKDYPAGKVGLDSGELHPMIFLMLACEAGSPVR